MKSITFMILMFATLRSFAAEDAAKWLRKALVLAEAGKSAEAMDELRVGINCGFIRKDDTAEPAILEIQRAIESAKKNAKKPEQAALLVIHAVAIMGIGAEDKDAVALLNEAETLTSKLPEVFNTRAVFRMKSRDWKSAVDDLNKALELNPNYHDALINRLQCLQMLDEVEKANVDLIHAVRLQNKASALPK